MIEMRVFAKQDILNLANLLFINLTSPVNVRILKQREYKQK
jgi:hypothetical protein